MPGKKPLLPPGLRPGYDTIYMIGTSGVLDRSQALKVLEDEITNRLNLSSAAAIETFGYLNKESTDDRLFDAFIALREIVHVYPLTERNWGSGERLPLVHAEEIGIDALQLAFQAHYKASYQKLREVLEMVILQLSFYHHQDLSSIQQWARGETRTPNFGKMLDELNVNEHIKRADDKLCMIAKAKSCFDDFGVFIHTRGYQAVHAALGGANVPMYSPDSLAKFIGYFHQVARLCVLFLSAIFPAAIITTSAFKKFGYWDPAWLPREEHVQAIRKILSSEELGALEQCAAQNSRFQSIAQELGKLPDLNKKQIDSTFSDFHNTCARGPEAFKDKMIAIGNLLGVE